MAICITFLSFFFLIILFLFFLNSIFLFRIENTKVNTERKQVRTFSEMEAEHQEELEQEEAAVEEEQEEEEDEGFIYNPKNVPLDATGRPIPYWFVSSLLSFFFHSGFVAYAITGFTNCTA